MTDIQRLYLNGNTIEVIVDGEMSTLVHNVTIEQAMSIAKMYTRKYDTVRLCDDEYEAFITFRKGYTYPLVDTYYPEDYKDVAKKFGLYDESEDVDQEDLENEKWNNYWSDYNQCGVRIDY